MKLLETKKLENSMVELQIEVSKEEFAEGLTKAFKKNGKKISVPGFRKGKATRAMIEKIYGKEVFYEDAVNETYPEVYEKAVQEAKLEPIDRADVEIIKLDENGYTFKATVAVKPEVKLGKYKGVSAEKKAVSVTAKDVDAELEKYRQRSARLVEINDRAAKNEDTVTIDYSGSVDGVKFDGGTAQKQDLKLGSGSFIPGFEEQVVGHKIGDSFDVKVTFPKEYHAADLAGKDAVFAVTLHEIKQTEYPTIDDEFVKDVSSTANTVAEFKNEIKANLKLAIERQADAEYEDALIDAVVENMTVEVPHVLVDRQLDQMCSDYDYRLHAQGLDLKSYLQMLGTDLEGFKKNFEPQGLKRAKTKLALEAIAKQEKLTVDEKTLENEYEMLAKQYQMEVKDVKKYVPEFEIEKDILMNKAIEFVKENAVAKAANKTTEKKDDAVAEKKPATKKPAAKKETTAKKEPAKKATTTKKTTTKKTTDK